MKKIIFVSSLLSALFISQFADAQAGNRNINNRQLNQQARIQAGIQHGDLTRREATRLRMQQAQIRGMKRMAAADGIITPKERHMIARAQQRASNNIYQDRNNGNSRFRR
jgi:hypothetical protein